MNKILSINQLGFDLGLEILKKNNLTATKKNELVKSLYIYGECDLITPVSVASFVREMNRMLLLKSSRNQHIYLF